jgi:hypothetical protein
VDASQKVKLSGLDLGRIQWCEIPADLVRLKTYLLNQDREELKASSGTLEEFHGRQPLAPNNLAGVDRLAMPDFLVEIKATASID